MDLIDSSQHSSTALGICILIEPFHAICSFCFIYILLANWTSTPTKGITHRVRCRYLSMRDLAIVEEGCQAEDQDRCSDGLAFQCCRFRDL